MERAEVIKRIGERAGGLLEDGYSFHPWGRVPGRFDCVTPTREHAERRAKGRPLVYTLDVAVSGAKVAGVSCDCEAYGRWQVCKHGARLAAEVEKALRLAACFATAPARGFAGKEAFLAAREADFGN